MKCPNCGAEGSGNFCEYCGSQLQGQRPKCAKCGSTNVSFSRENHGEIRGKRSKQVIHSTVGFCKDCGNTWYITDPVPKKEENMVMGFRLAFYVPAPSHDFVVAEKGYEQNIEVCHYRYFVDCLSVHRSGWK